MIWMPFKTLLIIFEFVSSQAPEYYHNVCGMGGMFRHSRATSTLFAMVCLPSWLLGEHSHAKCTFEDLLSRGNDYFSESCRYKTITEPLLAAVQCYKASVPSHFTLYRIEFLLSLIV